MISNFFMVLKYFNDLYSDFKHYNKYVSTKKTFLLKFHSVHIIEHI